MSDRDSEMVPAWVLAHTVDDYEKQRTAALRRVDAQVDLLLDALHALRHDRLAVADEFVDRAITTLRTTVVDLRHAPPDPRDAA